MSDIAVVGNEEFLLGFQLAGISTVFPVEEGKDPAGQIENIMKMEKVGILVIDEKTFESLSENLKYKMNKSVKPVIVIISSKLGSSGLRESIIKAIGVDLMKE